MDVKKEVQRFSSSADFANCESLADMKDGERVKQLLEKHGKAPKDLERALGKSRQMVHIYLTTARYTPNMRATVRDGLDQLGIDPGELSESATTITDPAELRSLLDGIPHDALPRIKRMLEITDRTVRIGLIALIDDRIERKR